MSQPFTPLVGGSPTLANGPKPAAAFAALRHDHENSANPSDAKPGVDAVSGLVSTSGTSSNGPRLTLKREGDRITQVTIHCTCGQVLHLACSY